MSPFCNPLSTLHLATWCSTRLCLRFFDVLLRISCCQRRGHTWLSRFTGTQFLRKASTESTGAMAASRHNRSLPLSSCCYRHSCHHLTVVFFQGGIGSAKRRGKHRVPLDQRYKSGWWCNNHLEIYEFVNGKDDISYMKWKRKKSCLKPPTRNGTGVSF